MTKMTCQMNGRNEKEKMTTKKKKEKKSGESKCDVKWKDTKEK